MASFIKKLRTHGMLLHPICFLLYLLSAYYVSGLPGINQFTGVEWWVKQTRFLPSHNIVYNVVEETENLPVIICGKCGRKE